MEYNVLSLFDGMGCGQIALIESGIKFDTYYASEIDKYAIKQSTLNFPDTIHLGSVSKISIKTLALSEVYSYITAKYNNEEVKNVQSLQSCISEREMLHRINKKQTFAAYFGAQKQEQSCEVPKNTVLSTNDRVWFFRNKLGNSRGIYDIIRSGERRNIPNCIPIGDLCKHSFWWNGYGQHEQRIKKEGIFRTNWLKENGKNKGKIKGICDKAIFIERVKTTPKGNGYLTIQRPPKNAELYKWSCENRPGSNGCEEKRNRKGEKRSYFYKNEGIVQTNNDNARTCKNCGSKLQFYSEIQASIIECEWGVIVQKGVFEITCGGSPCQSFSFAGKRKGMATKCEIEILSLEHYLELKSANFEFEGQSYLFWEYIRILTEIRKYNPDVKFLLENVEMGEKWEKVLSKAIGVNGIHINSALVSAQNRKRIYWTNIGLEPGGLFGDLESIIQQPEDRKILLKDILQPESEVDGKYYLSEKHAGNLKTCLQKSGCLTAGAHSGGNHSDMDLICVAMRGRGDENNQQLEPRIDNKTNCLTSVQKDNLIAYGCDYRKDEGFRVRKEEKSNTLMARAREDIYGTGLVCHNMMPRSSTTGKGGTGHLQRDDGKTYCLDTGKTNAVELNQSIRRLTPTECARLQTIPDWYKWEVSDTQQYKMLGNGWNIETIKHILGYL